MKNIEIVRPVMRFLRLEKKTSRSQTRTLVNLPKEKYLECSNAYFRCSFWEVKLRVDIMARVFSTTIVYENNGMEASILRTFVRDRAAEANGVASLRSML